MLKQQKIFFDFLRFCIGSAKDIPDSLKEADWKELYAIAKKQCLVGVLFDVFRKLPAEHVGMKKELQLQWMAESQILEKANVRLNDAAIQVSEWFRKKGFRTCILKGQGNALMYPNPYSRTPGDIDIWVEGGDKRVISFVRSISPHEKACYHHIEFPSYKGVEVEVHYRPSFLLCFWHNRRLQKYYERVKEEQFSHRVMLGEQGEIAIPTAEFNLIFQLTHIFTHLMNEGIGLRQLVDYYYVICDFYKVYQNSSKITPSLFTLKEGDFSNHPVPLSKEGSTFSPSPSSSGSGDVTAPSRCSEPLRSKVGGPSKVSPDCAGWDRLTERVGDRLGDSLGEGLGDRLDAIGDMTSASTDTSATVARSSFAAGSSSAASSITSVSSASTTDSSASTAFDVVQRDLKHLGLWKFAGAVMYVLKEVLGLSEEKMIAPMDEKRGRLLLAEILDGGNFGRHFTKYAGFTHQSMGKKYFLKIWRNMHFVRYYPAEALCEPLFRTWHFFWRMKNKK